MPASRTTRTFFGCGCCGPTEMRRVAALLAVLLLPCLTAWAGAVTVSVTDESGKALRGAVVFLEPAPGTPSLPVASAPAVMDQIDKAFVPQVLVVTVGSDVSFPNSDHIRHHVYSFSEARSFELPLYAGTPADPVRFPTPGVVVLGCNIHDWMRGYIVVVPQPLFATTGEDGKASISGIPAGRWRVSGWHPDVAEQRSAAGGEIDGAEPASTADLRLALKRKLQLRRAPAGRTTDRY